MGWDGHDGQQLHIDQLLWDVDIVPDGGAVANLIQWLYPQNGIIHVSEWFTWNRIHTIGVPSTIISFQAGIVFTDPGGQSWGPIWSNVITKQIIPEPSSLLAMGTGVLGMGGLLLRRRKSSV